MLGPSRTTRARNAGRIIFDYMFLCEKGASLKGAVQLPLASDNQGNVYGLLNAYPKKMPTAKLLMEIMF